MDLSNIIEFIANFALSNPKLAGILSVAYLTGIGLKVLREAVEKFVLESPSKNDDIILDNLKKKDSYKIISYVLDLLIRLKKPESK